MAETTKKLSERDFQQVLKGAFNDVDKSLTTNGFLTGKIGHKVVITNTSTTVPNDTQVITFSDNGTTLYTLTLIFTDGSQATLMSAERTA